MASLGQPLVMLHGITSSGRAWDPLVAELAGRFDVHTPTALGHRGRRRSGSSTTLTDFVDDAQRYLDGAGLDRAHLVGHSLGGYVALELARRGRALSVTALSPAGFWSPGDGTAARVSRGTRSSARIARYGAVPLKLMVSTAAGRRFWMGAALRNPAAMTAQQGRDVIEDQAGCSVAGHLAIGDDEVVQATDPLPCPMTVAWAENDEVLPMAEYAMVVRRRLPQARFVVLPGVGHAAMVDDPDLVVRTIVEAIAVADP